MVRGIVEELVCVAVLVCAALYALAPTVFQAQMPFYGDSLFADAPWESERPEGWTGAKDLHAPETAAVYYPAYRFIHDSAQAGESVLWNPLEYGGAPFLAQWRTRCLSPFTLPFYMAPLDAAFRISAFLKVLIAGLCAYGAARRLGYHRPFSLMVAAFFQLSAGLLLWLAHPLSDVLPWFPLFFVSCELMSLGHSRYWAPGGIGLGLMLLGGAPEAVIAAVGFVVVYHGVRLVFSGGRGGVVRPALGLTGACAGALALAAVQIAPYVEMLESVSRAPLPSPASLGILDGIALISLRAAAMVGATGGGGPALALAGQFHVGLIALLLVVLWAAVRSAVADAHRARIDALLVVTAVTMVGAFIVSHVPIFLGPLRFEAAHFLLPVSFVLGIAGASAAESWLELNPAQCTAAIKRLGLLVPAFVVGFALWFGALMGFGDGLRGTSAVLLMSYLGFGVAFFLLLGITLVRPLPSVIGYGLAILVFGELAWQTGPFQPFSSAASIAPESEFVRHLDAENARVGGGEGLWSWPLAANGIAQIGGASGIAPRRTTEFLERCAETPALLMRAGCPTLVLSREDIDHGFARLRARLRMRHVFPSGAVQFDNLGASERARLVYDVRQAETTTASDVSADSPPIAEWESPLSLRADEEGRLTMDAVHNDSITLTVRHGGDGVAVVADSYFPGWVAYANDVETPLFPVDHAFRGVAVGPGETTIDMRYEPVSYRLGLYISAIAALTLVAGCANLVYGWARKRAATRANHL